MGISISRKAVSMINLLYWSIPYIVSKVNNLILQAAKSSKLYRKHQKVGIPTVDIVYSSMTSLLTHAVAHSNRPSFRPKTNWALQQPEEKTKK